MGFLLSRDAALAAIFFIASNAALGFHHLCESPVASAPPSSSSSSVPLLHPQRSNQSTSITIYNVPVDTLVLTTIVPVISSISLIQLGIRSITRVTSLAVFPPVAFVGWTQFINAPPPTPFQMSSELPTKCYSRERLEQALELSQAQPGVGVRRIEFKHWVPQWFADRFQHRWVRMHQLKTVGTGEHVLSCFDPSHDGHNNPEYALSSGCSVYEHHARPIREFLVRHWHPPTDDSESFEFRNALSNTARTMAILSLEAEDATDFVTLLNAHNGTTWKKSFAEQTTVEEADALWKASSCIVPMLGEVGNQGMGVRDHLIEWHSDSIYFDNSVVNFDGYAVSPVCARLATEYLRHFSLREYVLPFASMARVELPWTRFEDMCQHVAPMSCQEFPHCWKLALRERVAHEFPQCRIPSS